VPPAIGNAVREAIGARLYSIPLLPERVLAALQQRDAGREG
jgi:CO/xanthine dehydrogenase Mo-binding subunit